MDIDSTRQQLIGLKTANVDRGVVGGTLRTVARVSMDETRVRKVNVKVSGFVEKIFVDFVGKPVRKGHPLFSLYSPEILTAENEYLLALKRDSGDGAARARPARSSSCGACLPRSWSAWSGRRPPPAWSPSSPTWPGW